LHSSLTLLLADWAEAPDEDQRAAPRRVDGSRHGSGRGVDGCPQRRDAGAHLTGVTAAFRSLELSQPDAVCLQGFGSGQRDARMMKVKQKISGGFRCIAGATDFATIRSFIATAKKQGRNVIQAIAQEPKVLVNSLRIA
jgi:hypothetical protein